VICTTGVGSGGNLKKRKDLRSGWAGAAVLGQKLSTGGAGLGIFLEWGSGRTFSTKDNSRIPKGGVKGIGIQFLNQLRKRKEPPNDQTTSSAPVGGTSTLSS